MSLAIEPLFCLGLSNQTKVLQDNWTVITNDLSAHFEETIYIHKDKVEIVTLKE
jgi:methionine aminopeptidase